MTIAQNQSSMAQDQSSSTNDESSINAQPTDSVYTYEEVSLHHSLTDCWCVVGGVVYDVTEFLEAHPGGAELILRQGGKDVTSVMSDDAWHRHSKSAYALLKQYKIGVLQGSINDPLLVKDDNLPNVDDEEEELLMTGYKEELLDWEKGMVAQVHKLGAEYKKWVYSPVNKQLRLFNSDVCEFFSKTPWYVVPIIWLPVVLYCVVVASYEMHGEVTSKYLGDSTTSNDEGSSIFRSGAAQYALTALLVSCLFGIGVPLWTLIEYLLHRYLFHIEPRGDSPFLITLHFFLHGQHHKVPFDGSRLVFPPVGAACFAFPIHSLLIYLCPGGLGRAVFAGGLSGYIVYDLMHYYLHIGAPTRGSYLHSLKRYHVLHHFEDPSTGYGISTKFWDDPFKTVNKKLKYEDQTKKVT